jgi:hypothetical protein
MSTFQMAKPSCFDWTDAICFIDGGAAVQAGARCHQNPDQRGPVAKLAGYNVSNVGAVVMSRRDVRRSTVRKTGRRLGYF